MAQMNVELVDGAGQAPKPFHRIHRVAQVSILVCFLTRMSIGPIITFLFDGRTGEAAPQFGYLQPFPVAFGIWPIIYAFQACFSFWQLCQTPGQAPLRRCEAIRGMALGWIFMSIITVIWNFATNLWFAGLCLTGNIFCLYCSWLAVVAEKETWEDYLLLNVPITLHLGWGTAAALLTWSNVVAGVTTSVAANLGFLFFELALAGGLSVALARRHQAPLLVYAVTWAVFWVGVGTLVPIFPAPVNIPGAPSQREFYDATLGEVGRYVLGGVELALALGLAVAGYKSGQATEVTA